MNILGFLGVSRVILAVFLIFTSGFSGASDYDFIDEDWNEYKTLNFHLITDLNDEKARSVIADLENFRHYLPRLADVQFEEYTLPIRLFAFSSTSDFQNYMKDSNLAGVFYPTEYGGVSAMNLADYRLGDKPNFAKQILQHELAHYISYSKVDSFNAPKWYEEGMAVYYSTMMVNDDLLKYGQISTEMVMSYQYSQKGESILPVESVLKKINNFHSDKGNINYSTATIFVHYSMSDAKRKKSFDEFVLGLKSGLDTDAAWDAAYKMSYMEMGIELKRYLKKGKFKYKNVNLKKPYNFGEVSFRQLSKNDLKKKFSKLELAVANNGYEDRVETLLGEVQTPEAMLIRAEAFLGAGNLDKAEELISLGGDFTLNQSEFYGVKARLLLARSIKAGNTLEKIELLGQSRAYFRKSLSVDVLNIKSYLGMADVYISWVQLDPNVKITEGINSAETAVYFQKDANTYRRLAALYLAVGYDNKYQEVAGKMAVIGREAAAAKANSLHVLCNSSSNSNEWKQAKNYCEKAYSLDSSALAINNLAWLYTVAKDPSVADAKRALELAKLAVEESFSEEPNYLDTLAAAYAINGDFDSAITIQKVALSLADGNMKAQFKKVIKAYKEGKTFY